MDKFIRKILLLGFVFFLFDKIFYLFLVVSPSLEKDCRLEQVITGKLNKEIIILGSSRGARNIIAGQIEDSISRSTYNLSYPGSDIEFHEFLLESLLEFNQKPKLILLAVDDSDELLPDPKAGFRYDVLYPLARYNYINNEMIARGQKSILSKILVLARINKRNFDIREKTFNELDTIITCGSMPISFQRKNRSFKYNYAIEQYNKHIESDNKVKAFLEFQNFCIDNNIKLVLVFSPNFRRHNPMFEHRLRQLTDPNVDYLIYDASNKIYEDKSYYYDENHLQTKGAVIFTNEIINFIKTKTGQN